jgi:hypothetical protein
MGWIVHSCAQGFLVFDFSVYIYIYILRPLRAKISRPVHGDGEGTLESAFDGGGEAG